MFILIIFAFFQSYNFTYFVSDHIHDINVTIEAVITDTNDNMPVFNQSVYNVDNVMEEDDSITPENKKFLVKVSMLY